MTDRERLVELLREVDNMRLMRCGYKECADHILADGWMRPPCKVGTTVYCIIDGFDTVAEGIVRFYTVHKDCIIYEVAINGYYAQRYTDKDFGYKIFFEREEAVNALRDNVPDTNVGKKGGESDA